MATMKSRVEPLLRPLVAVPLVLASLVSSLMLFMGFFYTFSLWGDSKVNSPTYFVCIFMMSVLPIFVLVVFISRKILAVVMWLLVIVNYYGGYVLLAVGSSIYYSRHGVPKMVIDAFFTPPAMLSIAMAVLVQFAYQMERRGMLKLNDIPKDGGVGE